jgi:hypothetical protein
LLAQGGFYRPDAPTELSRAAARPSMDAPAAVKMDGIAAV